jgi:hypothetical protein
MWPGLLIVLGSCIAGVILGFFLYQLIARFLQRPGTGASEAEAQTPTSLARDATTSNAPTEDATQTIHATTEVQAETPASEPDRAIRDMLHTAPEAMKDDKWLNTGVEEVSSDIIKQQDDDWLNAEEPEPPPPAPGRSIRFLPPLVTPDVSVPPARPEPAAMNLRIEVSPPGPGRAVDDTAVPTAVPTAERYADDGGVDDDSLTFEGTLDDIVGVRSTHEPAGQAGGFVSRGPGLTDVASASDSGGQAAGSQALMDNVAIRTTGGRLATSGPLADEVSVRALPGSVGRVGILMDEVAVRPVERPVATGPVLADGVTVRQGDGLGTRVPPLMDAVETRPPAGPVKSEYALLEDLITKGGAARARAARSDAAAGVSPLQAAASTVQSPEEAETLRPLTVEEISELFEQRETDKAAAAARGGAVVEAPFPSRLGKLFGRRPAVIPALKEKRRRAAAAAAGQFLTWRTVLGLTAGLVVGAALGLGYYQSPLRSASGVSWESSVEMQVLYPEQATYVDPRSVYNAMQYYVLQNRSSAFMEFAAGRIVQDRPGYQHTAAQLAGMITVTYMPTGSDPVTTYKINVKTPSQYETEFLADNVAGYFRDYLTAQEDGRRQAQVQNTTKAMDDTRAALLEAQHQLALKAQAVTQGAIEDDPEYVRLTARMQTLRTVMDNLKLDLTDTITQSAGATADNETSIMAALQQTSAAILAAQTGLANLQVRYSGNNSAQKVDYQIALGYVTDLNDQLTRLNEQKASMLSSLDNANQSTDQLLAGSPSVTLQPIKITSTISIIIGAMAGAAVAWVVLNFGVVFGKRRSDAEDADTEED